MTRSLQLGRFRTPADLLGYEILQEKASAIGRLGRALERALTELREFDTLHPPSQVPPTERQRRRALVAEAGHALWMFVVQREACGLLNSRTVMSDYRVPLEVQEQMGAFPAAHRVG
jgi:hypothetical protein